MRVASSSHPSAVLAAALVIVFGAAAWPGERTEAAAAESEALSAPVPAAAGSVAGVDTAVEDEVDELTDAALRALGSKVSRSSHEDALRSAFHAYYSYRDENPGAVKKPYLYYVDLGLGNRTKRGWVFDMERLTVVDGPFTVAHGRGSLRSARDGVPNRFSNQPGSKASSLGLYLAQETYTFSGKSGGRRYTSVGLRMRGESGPFNSAARRRGIVAHGAPYVTAAQAGRSEGCPAMEMQRARRLLPLIANGGVVFIFSPRDPNWLESDPWVN